MDAAKLVIKHAPKMETGGHFTAIEDGHVVGTLSYTDHGALVLESEITSADCLPFLIEAVADEARSRRMKLRTSDERIEAILESEALRDVRAPGGSTLVSSSEHEIPVPVLLKELLTRINWARAKRSENHRLHEAATGPVRASVHVLSDGSARVSYSPKDHVQFSAELSGAQARAIVSGEATEMRVLEALYRPDPLELVQEAEAFIDARVDDGSLGLALTDDDPRQRHRCVFALADRIADLWASWKKDADSTQWPNHAQALAEWLVAQPEVDDLMMDQDELFSLMLPVLWPRAV